MKTQKTTGRFQKAFDQVLAMEAGRQLMLSAASFVSRSYVNSEGGSKPGVLRCHDLRDAVVPMEDILAVVERLYELADEYAKRRDEIERSFPSGALPAKKLAQHRDEDRLQAVG